MYFKSYLVKSIDKYYLFLKYKDVTDNFSVHLKVNNEVIFESKTIKPNNNNLSCLLLDDLTNYLGDVIRVFVNSNNTVKYIGQVSTNNMDRIDAVLTQNFVKVMKKHILEMGDLNG